MAWVRFLAFELNEQTYELRKSGVPVKIQQQPARVLALLIARNGLLVSRSEIRTSIWGEDTFVDFEQGLNFCIRQIRLVLNDSAESPRFLETLPRLGYRFIAPVEKVGEVIAGQQRSSQPSRLRIALLPIRYLEGEAEDYFTIGLTEDMISALARLDPERLRVVLGPRLQPQEVDEACLDRLQRELTLDHLLRISVRRSAETLRISAQLHDLKDRCVMWSEAYDRQSADLLEVQAEVAMRVSQSLAVELLPRSVGAPRKYAPSAAAYDAYLKGRYFWHKMTNDAMRSSIQHFSESIAIDPNFAPAYAGLADCYAQMGSVRVPMMKPLDALAKARPLLDRAMELDNTLVEAHCTLGLLKSWYELDWNGADRAFQMALSLDPSNVTALVWRSLYLTCTGRRLESIASVQRALECEPLSPVVNAYLGMARVNAGQYDLGIRVLNQAIELDPHYYRAYMFLGNALIEVDRNADAISAFEMALSINPHNLEALAFLGAALATAGDHAKALEILAKVQATEDRFEPAVLVAAIYASLDNFDGMMRYLQLAYERKSSPIYIVRFLKCFRRYEPNPRFRAFVASLGLPPTDPV